MFINKNSLYASWELLSFCNLACSHCYSTYNDEKTQPKMKTLGLEKIKLGLHNLSKSGVTQMNLEGGEPTLLGLDLVELVGTSKECGMETIISTHGMFLFRNNLIEKLVDVNLDALSLSLDGATKEINDSIRINHAGKSAGQYEKVMEFLRWYTARYTRGEKVFKLKINCVVRRDNLIDLRNLGEVLAKVLPKEAPVQIKLVQVQPRGCAKGAYSNIEVTKEEVRDLVEHVAATSYFPVVSRYYDGGTYPFIIVTHNGFTTIPKGEKHEIISIDGKPLNVLGEEFPEEMEKFLNENPDFKEKNTHINTYTMK